MKQKDGKDIKKNIDFSLVMSQVIEEAFHKPFAFFDLQIKEEPERHTSVTINRQFLRKKRNEQKILLVGVHKNSRTQLQ